MLETAGRPKMYGVKILIGSAAGLVLSLGLCGGGSALGNFRSGYRLVWAGVGVLAVSILGLIVGVVWSILDSAKNKM